jgi:peptide deformylase
VADFGTALQNLIAAMGFILREIPYGWGLSAIQIGVPLRVALVTLNRTTDGGLVIVNPTKIATQGRLTARVEGCLCLPDHKASVRRRNKVSFSAQDRFGRWFDYVAVGYEAAIIQHELDHMDGKFYWDLLASGEQPAPILSNDRAR